MGSESRKTRLGVNVDHIATLRNQRDTLYPDPVTAAAIAELAGADQITVHLREDRRHIRERDVRILRQTVQTVFNLEMATTDEMLALALDLRPDTVTLVPEKREERTTEGGLDVIGDSARIENVTRALQEAGIQVSLFVDPNLPQLERSAQVGATIVELHTGDYADAAAGRARMVELNRLIEAANAAHELGLVVAAGHGLDYVNTAAVAAIEVVEELNIGHSIVSRASLVGFERAVREIIGLIESA